MDTIKDDGDLYMYIDYAKAMNSKWKNEFSELKNEKSVQDIIELYDKLHNLDNETKELIDAILECDLAENVFDAIKFIDNNSVSFEEGNDIHRCIMEEVNNHLNELPNWMIEIIENQISDSDWVEQCDPEYDFGVELYETSNGLLVVA